MATSRLSSLLVRDGLVSVKRMERAFQRQVLDGGTLDTILLELGIVPEARLTQYLALASGLPPIASGDLAALDPSVTARCPREIAEAHQIVPLGWDGDALRVVTRDPVDLRGLESLADELAVPIQPFVAPDVHVRVAAHRIYGKALEERYARLAETLRAAATGTAVGRSPTVVIEPPAPAAPPPAPKPAAASPEPAAPRAATEREISRPLRAASEGDTVEITVIHRARTEPAVLVEVAPLATAAARAMLGTTERRDEVFEILLRAVRAHAWYAGLLTIQGRAAVGRFGLLGDEPDDAIANVLLPLDEPSAFRKAVEDGAPYIGPIATGDPAIDGMIARMGGVLPPAALLLPIALRGRVVAVVVGHRGADTLQVSEVSELLPLATVAADALGRIIKHKKDRAATSPDGVPIAAMAHAASAPVAAPPTGDAGDALLVALERADGPAARDAALRAAVEHPDRVLATLAARFPGRLDHPRGGPPHPVEAHGPLLALAVRLGPAVHPLLATAVEAAAPDARWAAARLIGALDAAALRPALVARLLDDDDAVREAAVDALRPAVDLEPALAPIRRAVLGHDRTLAFRAVEALAALDDLVAIPSLVDAVGEPATQAAAAAALARLGKQDFGPNPKKWRQWWDRNKTRHPIEWMLEGLDHKSVEVRRASIEDLRRWTGEYHGYHHDLGKREREAARQRWLLWWAESGRRRFLRVTRPMGAMTRPS